MTTSSRSTVIAIVFILAMANALIATAGAPPKASASRQSLNDAWWTAPLLAASPGTLSKGHFLVEPFASAGATVRHGLTAGADQIRIHYLQRGPARASHTLLLIPGWRISASIWSLQLDYFASRGDRVVAIDSRSQGESSIAASGNAPEDRAEDIQRVIASLRLDHVILIGWSQGAQDVAAYVDLFGTRALDGLVLVDSPVSAGPDDVLKNPGFIKVIASGIGVYAKSPRAYSDGMMHAIMRAAPPQSSYWLLDDQSMKTPVDIGISMLVQDLLTTDRRPYLKKFDKPTLVIASGESPLIDGQRQMAGTLPHAEFSVIQHAAHAVFVDQPDEFDQRLDTFITSLDARRLHAETNDAKAQCRNTLGPVWACKLAGVVASPRQSIPHRDY